jgi:hypothetical protein
MVWPDGGGGRNEQMVLGVLERWKDVYRSAVSQVVRHSSDLTISANSPSSLAMAEMTALMAAIYREYTTSIAPGFENKTPAITSRFEMFYDVTVPEIAEHTCMIKFTKR